MRNREILKMVLKTAVALTVVATVSYMSVMIQGGKTEKPAEKGEYVISWEMTVEQFGRANDLSNPVLKELFDLGNYSRFGTRSQRYSATMGKISSWR